MKISHLAAGFAAGIFFTGCSSLENPFARLFRSGHDARTFNSQTGQFEWPEEKKPRSRKASTVSDALAGAPASRAAGDGRYFDAQKNQWIDPKPTGAATAGQRSKPADRLPAFPGAASAPNPVLARSDPAPARATGYYNTSTGKIEWSSGAPIASTPPPAPARVKRWWWPF